MDEKIERKKPCYALGYCPYGILVEAFPLYEKEKAKAIELGWYCKRNPKGTGWIACDKDDEDASPDIGRVFREFGHLDERSCAVFGHNCPVFYVAEDFTEETWSG